ncbi:MAG: hypothetical protein RR702_04010 [Clostridia bacterium]
MNKFFKEMKENVFKDKGYIIAMLILAALTIMNIFFYFSDTNPLDENFSPYSFWSHVRITGISAGITMKIIPIVILIAAVTTFAKELYTGYYKNYLSRQSYKKYLISKIKWCYIRAALTIPVMSIVVYCIGLLIYPSNISPSTLGGFTGFLDDKAYTATAANAIILYLTLPQILYTTIIATIGIIVTRYCNKIYIVYAGGYIGYLVMNYFFSNNITLFLYSALGKPKDFTNISLSNLYNALAPAGEKYIMIYQSIILCFLIILMCSIYKNKEKLVLGNTKSTK